MRYYLVKSQQQANFREAKALWGTWQVDYIGPMTHTSEGWKFIMTGAEIVGGLGSVCPTCTVFGLATVAGFN